MGGTCLRDRKSTQGLLKNCVGKREAKLYPSLTEKESGVLDLKVSFNMISNTNFHLFVRSIYQIHFMQLHPVALLFLWANTVASFHKKRERAGVAVVGKVYRGQR